MIVYHNNVTVAMSINNYERKLKDIHLDETYKPIRKDPTTRKQY